MTKRCNETTCFCQLPKVYVEWKREKFLISTHSITELETAPIVIEVPRPVAIFDKVQDPTTWDGAKPTPKVLVVDNSVLESWSVCELKTYYHYLRNLVPSTTSDALSYGSSIHEGMAAYYVAGRNPGSDACIPILTDVLPLVCNPVELRSWIAEYRAHVEECKQCSSVFAFLKQANAADSPLPGLEASDKRSIIGGVETLIAYETHYHSVDNLVPLSDDHIEVGFTVSLGESLCGGFEILFCGKIDAICKDKQGLLIADHKTSWSLAQMWQ